MSNVEIAELVQSALKYRESFRDAHNNVSMLAPQFPSNSSAAV